MVTKDNVWCYLRCGLGSGVESRLAEQRGDTFMA